jgi:hypothetical protein
MKVVGFLQNAWSGLYAGDTWPRESWLRALAQSQSGRRLRFLSNLCPDIDFWWDNVTEIVGATPDSVVPASKFHIRSVLKEQKPELVIAFGIHATKALLPFKEYPLLCLPHPASRTLTNKLYKRAAYFINRVELFDHVSGRVIALSQTREGYKESNVDRTTQCNS